MQGLVYLLGSGFILYLVFKFAKQIFFKILFFLLLIAGSLFALYYFEVGPFNKNVAHISVIEQKYCQDESQNDICDCIVKPLSKDINQRFSEKEIEDMKEDRIMSAYVFQKSISKISNSSKDCLKQKDKEDLWSVFIKETLQLDNAVVQKIEELIEDGKTKVDEKIQESTEKKEALDNRY